MAGTGTSASSSPLHADQVAVGSAQARNLASIQAGPLTIARTIITVDANTGTGALGVVEDTDEINLIILPPMAVLLLGLSTLILSASQGATTEIDLGYRAFTDMDAVAVAEDVDGIYNGYDSAVTTLNHIAKDGGGALGALSDVSGIVVFNNIDPVTLFMKALDAAGTYDGDIADTYGFMFVYVTI